MGGSTSSSSSNQGKDDDLADLINRFINSLADYSDLLPFSVDRQKLRSYTTLAALAITLVLVWKILRSPPQEPQRRPRRRASPSSSGTTGRSSSSANPSTNICSSSDDSRAQDAINHFFQPVNLTLEQIVRHKLNEGRKVTCRLLGVILEETTPEELQFGFNGLDSSFEIIPIGFGVKLTKELDKVTVRSSVLEVLHEIAKFCDVYLMERILDDESGEKVLSALSDAGVFTSGGLMEEKVLFCSTENGRMSFVRQLEPDWHIDSNPEIVQQLARFIKYELHISPQRVEKWLQMCIALPA